MDQLQCLWSPVYVHVVSPSLYFDFFVHLITVLTLNACTHTDMSTKATSVKSKLQQSLQKELPVLVVAGPSGSGKSTLLSKLFKQYDMFTFSVSRKLLTNGEFNLIIMFCILRHYKKASW